MGWLLGGVVMTVWIIRGLDAQRQPAEIWSVVAELDLVADAFPRAQVREGEQLWMGNKMVAKIEAHEVYTG